MSFLTNSTPCMRLAPAKFALTNQDSEGGENCAVLTSMCLNGNRKDIAHLFSSETAFIILKPISEYKTNRRYFVSPRF